MTTGTLPAGNKRVLIGTISLFFILILAGGYAWHRHSARQHRTSTQQYLNAIANLKCSEIEHWRQERLADARILSFSNAFRRHVVEFLLNPQSTGPTEDISAWLSQYAASGQYVAAHLIDENGMIRLSTDSTATELNSSISAVRATARTTGRSMLTDFSRDTDSSKIHMSLVVPLPASDARPGDTRSAGYIAFVIDPEFYLYPFIQKWPTPSRTAETLLLKRDGNDVLYLNELRHQPGSALTLRVPLTRTDIPAVKAVLTGGAGSAEGPDYRGVAVVGAFRPIQGSNWVMVSKVDIAELDDEHIRNDLFLIAGLISLMTISILALYGWWSARQRSWLMQEAALAGQLKAANQQLRANEQQLQAANQQLRATEQQLKAANQQLRAETEERTQAEIVVKRNEELLRTVTSSTLDAIIMMDDQGNAAFWNAAAERIFGYKQDEIIGRDIHEVLCPTRFSDAFRRGLVSFRSSGTGAAVGQVLELAALHKDGREFPIEIALAPIRRHDAWWAIAVIRDITERKKAEEMLRENQMVLKEAQRIARIGNWELDLLNNKLTWSDEIYRIFEIDPERFGASYDAFLSAIHPDDRAAVNTAYTQSLENHLTYGITHRLLMPDGRVKHVQEQCENFYDDTGQPIRSIGTVQDITERKQAEEHLLRAEKMAAVGQLAAGVAHEFNNIMNNIGLCSQMMRLDERLGPFADIQQSMTDVEGQIHRGAEIVRGMMTLSKPEPAGKAPVALNNMLDEVLRVQRRQLELESISVEVAIDPALAATVNRGRVLQVFLNLIINSRHAMKPKGSGILKITAGRVDDQVRIAFQDTGIGMDEETLKKAFEPFFTTKGAFAEDALGISGTGLGLPVSHSIIQAEGGDITVESSPGRGTTVTVILPACDAISAMPPGVARGAGTPVSSEASSRPQGRRSTPSVLLVDDEKILEQSIGRFFRKRGYQVTFCDESRTAAECLAGPERYAIMIFDLNMPGLTGSELARLARDAGQTGGIFIATGLLDTEPIAAALVPLGIERIIRKPLNLAELLAAVESYLAKDGSGRE
jgi:PAS domain S-box-containing protein